MSNSKSKLTEVYNFVGRVMNGYGRAGVNNVQVATKKLSKKVLPLEGSKSVILGSNFYQQRHILPQGAPRWMSFLIQAHL